MTNSLGQTTRCQYDPRDRLTPRIDPFGGMTSFQYDPNGNLLSMQDARNKVTPVFHCKENWPMW